MDLSTITTNLNANKYSDIKDVFNDFDLIWSNCMLYNGQDSAISQMAARLKKLTGGYFRKAFGNDFQSSLELKGAKAKDSYQ